MIQSGRSRNCRGEVLDRRDGRLVGPVQVLQDDDRDPPAGELEELGGDPVEQREAARFPPLVGGPEGLEQAVLDMHRGEGGRVADRGAKPIRNPSGAKTSGSLDSGVPCSRALSIADRMSENGGGASRSGARPSSTWTPRWRTVRRRSRMSSDLPTPVSPTTRVTPPWPARASSNRRWRASTVSTRPTNGRPLPGSAVIVEGLDGRVRLFTIASVSQVLASGGPGGSRRGALRPARFGRGAERQGHHAGGHVAAP